MLRSDGDHTTGYETPSVSATEDNEEIKLEGREYIRQNGVMTEAMAVSHPVVEYSGSVGLCGRHDATSGCFQCSEAFRAKSIPSQLAHTPRFGLSIFEVKES